MMRRAASDQRQQVPFQLGPELKKKPVASELVSSVAGDLRRPPLDIEPLYDARDVAERCKVSEKNLQHWARAGKIQQ